MLSKIHLQAWRMVSFIKSISFVSSFLLVSFFWSRPEKGLKLMNESWAIHQAADCVLNNPAELMAITDTPLLAFLILHTHPHVPRLNTHRYLQNIVITRRINLCNGCCWMIPCSLSMLLLPSFINQETSEANTVKVTRKAFCMPISEGMDGHDKSPNAVPDWKIMVWLKCHNLKKLRCEKQNKK